MVEDETQENKAANRGMTTTCNENEVKRTSRDKDINDFVNQVSLNNSIDFE